MKHYLFSLNLLILPCLFALSNFGDRSIPNQENEPRSCTLPAPSSLNGQVTSATTADLSWSSVSGAFAYALIVTDNGAPFLQTTVFGTTRALTGLTSGHTYQCKVISICGGSGGQASDFIITSLDTP